jgi:hypothetical protein
MIQLIASSGMKTREDAGRMPNEAKDKKAPII